MFTLISDVIADNLFLFRVLGSILIFVLFWAFKGTITKAVVNLLTKLLNRSRQIADQSTLRFVLASTVMICPCVTGVCTRIPVASICGIMLMRSTAWWLGAFSSCSALVRPR